MLILSSFIYLIFAISDDSAKQNENFQKKIDFVNEMKNNGFHCDSAVTFIPGNISFQVDYTNKKIAVCNFNYQSVKYYDLDKVINFDVVQNSEVIFQGGVGRAIVGGVIAGSTGGLVGAITRKSNNILSNTYIKIMMNDYDEPYVKINLLPYMGIESYANPNPYVTTINIEENQDIYLQIQEFIDNVTAILTNIINTKTEITNVINNNKPKADVDVFDLNNLFKKFGDQKIAIIKYIKEEYNLTLEQAKNIVDKYMKSHGLE